MSKRKAKKMMVMRRKTLFTDEELSLMNRSVTINTGAIVREGEPERKMYIMETPPTDKNFRQAVVILSDEELAEARRERPDLIIREPQHLIVENALQEPDQGESLHSMTIPAEDKDRWMKDLLKE